MTSSAASNENGSVEHGSIRILFLLNSLCIGGSERKTVRIANELTRRGYEVHVAYLNEPETLLPSLSDKIKVHALKRSGKFSFFAARKLGVTLVESKIQVLLCVNLHPLIYTYLARLFSLRNRIPVVALVNKSEFLGRGERRARLLHRHLLRRCERIVFGSKSHQQKWVSNFQLNTNNCRFVYNGVDLTHFDIQNVQQGSLNLKRNLGIDEDNLVVGTVGQMRPEKKQSDLIVAVARLRPIFDRLRLLIVGDGVMRVQLTQLVENLGLQDIVLFLGEVEDPRPALAIMDVFALTSIAVETFSNAALEAMAMRRPVVLSDLGGACEMVEHGHNGLIYNKGDVQCLADCIQTFCADASLRFSVGLNARATVEQNFSNLLMFEEYEKLIQEVVFG